MRRREFMAAIAATVMTPVPIRAQDSRRLPKIGFLYPGPQAAAATRSVVLLEGLRSAGFDAPSQATLITRATGGDPAQLAPMLADLIAANVDVLVALGPQTVRAAHTATQTLPIVTFDLESDPVESGFLSTLSRPDGNITGVFLDFPDFAAVWLQLLKEAIPNLSKLAVLWEPSTGTVQTRAVAAAAGRVNVKIEILKVAPPAGLEAVFDSASAIQPDGLLLLSSPIMSVYSKQMAALSLAHRLPAISLFANFARSGGLMAYGPDLDELYRKTGVLAAKVLKGARLVDLPAERPDRFELVLNIKTANTLNLTMPNSLLARADEVIE
jgi:putative ABC transport system substrate-binding protein